jgi:hypothetical protein
MDTSTVAYNHHGAWNAGTNTAGLTASSLPGGNRNYDPDGAGPLTGVDAIVAYSIGDDPNTLANEAQNIGSITFNAVAGEIYTIALGGYRTGAWNQINDGYSLTVSQVPVPAAVWLFGSALAGMGIIGRRKNKGALVA